MADTVQTWTSMRWRDWTPWIEAICERLPRRPLEVLEVGGVGKELAGFLERSGSTLSLVNSPDADICRKTRWADGHFDLILTKMGFEHFYDPFGAAREITRLLAPGGCLIVATVWSWRYHTAPGVEDYWRFSPVALRQLFPRLHVIETGYDLSDRRKDCRLDRVAVDELGGWREHWYSYLVARKPVLSAPPVVSTVHVFDLKWMDAAPEDVRTAIPMILAAPEYRPRLERIRQALGATDAQATAEAGPTAPNGPSDSLSPFAEPDERILGLHAFAVSTFCRDAEVLVLCADRGWGAYLAAAHAKSVVAVDAAAPTVAACRVHWRDPRIEWLVDEDNCLTCLGDRTFDVVLLTDGMPRASEEGVARYLAATARVLRGGGVLIGTLFFSASEADERRGSAAGPMRSRNQMLDLLHRSFSRATFAGEGLFIAVR